MRPSLYLVCAVLGLLLPSEAQEPIRVVLVGDSTVQSGSGWGDAFGPLLKPGVECVNLGKGGRSSKSFRAEGWWAKALALKPAYLLIQFGHNDQPNKGPARETDPRTTYPENMARYVDEAIAAGAQPIIVTSLTRRVFGADGKLIDGLTPYVEAARRVAEAKKIPLVDLYARSVEQAEKLGPDGISVLNAAGKPDAPGPDRTHLSEGGGKLVAPLVAGELRRIHADLAKHLHDTP